jgi:RHS repeat-associated protein
MGYYDTPEPEAAPRVISCASLKTHTPGSPVKERGHRFYSPAVGRWLSRDPIGKGGGANLYSFVKNGVVRLVDSDGRSVFVRVTWAECFPEVSPGASAYIKCNKKCQTTWQ